MPLGNRYIQTSDPSPVPSGGYEWLNPLTGELFVRSADNTTWTLVGSVNVPNLGHVHVGGGVFTGAIGGSHGLKENQDANFPTSVKRDGREVALKSELNQLAITLRNEFSASAAGIIAGAQKNSTTKANIAIRMGISDPGVTGYWEIPLPQYPDLTVAKESDCVWIPSVYKSYTYDDYVSGSTSGLRLEQHTTSPRLYRCYGLDNALVYGRFHYLIIGVR